MTKGDFEILKEGSITSPSGFVAGAVYAGIKKKAEFDLGILCCERECKAYGVFTKNQIKAHSVLLSQKNLKNGNAQAIVANSGCANACTGPRGWEDNNNIVKYTANKLNISEEDILTASTGVIGVPLPLTKMKAGIGKIRLTRSGGHDFAKSILTTDTFTKEIALRIKGDQNYIVAGVAKGAGMIHPDMATMFCFITTDANVNIQFLRKALQNSINLSFNMITVDGDTSTSDMVLILANGKANNELITPKNGQLFQKALNHICIYLAQSIARDGEGANKLIEINVEKAKNIQDAKAIARTIAGSMLVKSAIHGNDPNWGRIAAAIGRSGVTVVEKKLDIYLNNTCVLKNGIPQIFNTNILSTRIATSDKVVIKIALNMGNNKAVSWGCDLSEEYVTINSAYTT